MGDWEKPTGTNGAPTVPTIGEKPTVTNGESAAPLTTGTALDMKSVDGAIDEVAAAALKDRAKDAGWVDTIPVDYNIQQTNRDDGQGHYLAHSAVYEWADDYGDVGPEVPALEEQLFGGDFRVRQGDHMSNLQFQVSVEGPEKLQPARSVSLNVTSSCRT